MRAGAGTKCGHVWTFRLATLGPDDCAFGAEKSTLLCGKLRKDRPR
ncbi:hypothetical protein D516_0070 [Rhodobacter sp. AKP1]|nr:Hypothetical Protein RSKD131_3250 [Cereibacter sphaeroides KD131]EKX59714.1 hypothetical protein D516_0070 [Rhodobacter sp. AKP1]